MKHDHDPSPAPCALSDFIRANRDAILQAWEEFAATIPKAAGMPHDVLRDHVDRMLDDIVRHVASEQTGSLQPRLADAGEAPFDMTAAGHSGSAAELHGSSRLDEGFALDDLIAEYRLLRSTVLRLWQEQHGARAQRPPEDRTLDVAELMRFDEAVDRALAESVSRYIGRANHAREMFLGILGHDMRSPLGAIRMSAQYLLARDQLDGDQTKAATRVLTSSHRLQRILDDLLAAARVRLNGALPIDPEPTDVGNLAQQVVDECTSLHPDRQIVLDLDGELRGRWDSARLSQLLSNLVDNAIKHGASDRPVRVDLRGTADEVLVGVHNDGEPIPPEEQSALFDPLVRLAGGTRQRSAASGVGLGLFIARAIAEAHGGHIGLRSSRADGTSFIATLPREPQPALQRHHPG